MKQLAVCWCSQQQRDAINGYYCCNTSSTAGDMYWLQTLF